MSGDGYLRRFNSIASKAANKAKSIAGFGPTPQDTRKAKSPTPVSQTTTPTNATQGPEHNNVQGQPSTKTAISPKFENAAPPSTNGSTNIQSPPRMEAVPAVSVQTEGGPKQSYAAATRGRTKDGKADDSNDRLRNPKADSGKTLSRPDGDSRSGRDSDYLDLQRKYNVVHSELMTAQKKNEMGRQEVLKLQEAVARLQQESAEGKRNLETQLQSAMKQAEIRKLEIERVNAELEKERTLRGEEHALLDLRMRELQDARAYLTTEDAISGEEIKGMTEALNTEIYQVAAFMADTLDFDETLSADETNKGEAVRWIGEPLVGVLSSGAPKNDSEEETRQLATLAVIQTSIVQTCISLINTWSFHPNVNDHFAGLYANIRETSTSAVAGRWRAMTRARCKYLGPEKEIEGHLVHCLLRDLAPVLAIAGWKIPPSVKAESAIGALSQIFRTRLGQITRKMVRLDRAMGEGVISKDAQLCWVTAGTPFEPSLMENAYGKSPDISAGDVVLSTCDLGLMLSQISNDSNGAESGRGEEVQAQVLLKVKVVLHSALFEHK